MEFPKPRGDLDEDAAHGRECIFSGIVQYGLFTKPEVKMTRYWSSSFCVCLWTKKKLRSINTEKKNKAKI